MMDPLLDSDIPSPLYTRLQSVMARLGTAKPYSLYTLLILMIVFLHNQLNRFVLGIAGKSLAKDLQFGKKSCYLNTTYMADFTNDSTCDTMCNGFHNEAR